MDEAAAQSTYSVRAWGRRFGRQVIDFLAPPKCLVCHDAVLEPASLCPSCWARDAVKKEALRIAGIGYHEVVAGHTTPSELRRLVEKLVDRPLAVSS